MKSSYLKQGIILIALLSFSTSYSQTWTGGGSNWNDPANWSSNPSLPSNGSTIIINGSTATVDVASGFTPGEIRIINGGTLVINSTLDIQSEGFTYVTGSGSKLQVNAGGTFTAEFIFVSGGEVEVTGGELDVNDKFGMDNGTLTVSGGLLDLNGIESSNEETEIYNSSTVNVTGGEIQFNNSFIVTDSDFTTGTGATLTATNSNRNFIFHSSTASLDGTITNPNGDLSLFGTTVIDLEADVTMTLDDIVLNDDGQSSILNVYGELTAFDDIKFDEDPPDDIAGDSDQVIVKSGGNLTITDNLRDADDAEPGSNIHVESGGTAEIGGLSGVTTEEAYGGLLTSENGGVLKVNGSDPLPVVLIDFEATPFDDKVRLDWSTAVEINNAYFDLLRSTDGQNFVEIARIIGSGNTNDAVSYSYSDRDIESGNYYYQLKQVDFNGDFEYHPIIDIRIEGNLSNSISAYPNPVLSDFTIISNRDIAKPRLSIFSMSGRIVLEKPLNPSNRWTLNSSQLNLSNGTYILKIKDEVTGSTIDSIRISITK